MPLLKIILLAMPVLIVLLVIIISLQPADFTITRSATMNALPSTIFPQVNTLRLWEAWSPWAKLDPNAKSTFSGPDSGVNSVMTWSGNNQVGEGRMTILESRPHELIRFQLDFLRPMKATNIATFTFQPKDKQTVVHWTMTGKNNFVGKAFGLFVNCDKMVGGQFEQGLTQLRAVVEASKT